MEINKLCCESFKEYLPFFKWMQYQDDEGKFILVMPQFTYNFQRIRLNFCPTCGGNVRGTRITRDKYVELLK